MITKDKGKPKRLLVSYDFKFNPSQFHKKQREQGHDS